VLLAYRKSFKQGIEMYFRSTLRKFQFLFYTCDCLQRDPVFSYSSMCLPSLLWKFQSRTVATLFNSFCHQCVHYGAFLCVHHGAFLTSVNTFFATHIQIPITGWDFIYPTWIGRQVSSYIFVTQTTKLQKWNKNNKMP